MAVSGDAVAVLAAKFAVMRKVADERAWRVYLGSEAVALGHGGIRTVALAAGVSETTVAEGVREIESGEIDDLPPGRSRRPGGGRRRAGDTQPGLRDALRGLAGEATRGDPMAEITWCSLSLRELGRRMAARGFRVREGRDRADDARGRLQPAGDGQGAGGQAASGPGRPVPAPQRADRGVRGSRGARDQRGHQEEGAARRVSTGTGRSWRPKGNPVKVRDHDFPDAELGKITPYGVYDIAANRGFVSVGTSCDTGAFAVNALRLWWQQEGAARYPHATRLLVTADSGGSNGARCRLWKDQLAVLAAQTGLRDRRCATSRPPRPSGTSVYGLVAAPER